jgi:mannose-6-phosphate isomerase-like protein (cupin superfamily)
MEEKYFGNLEQATLANTDFRRVIHTGEHSQLVLMSLPVGGEIGIETHPHVDQFFRIEQGEGKVIMEGEEMNFSEDFAFIVPANTEHNIINTGSTELKLYTIYSPANHLPDRVHHTKEDADMDTEDEAFGHQV